MSSLIETGNQALKAGEWSAARDAFQTVLDESNDVAEALYGHGAALWWLGDMQGAISNLERAYAAFRRREDLAFAASVAVRLGFHCKAHLANEAAAAGWLGRAERLIEESGLDDLRGDLLLMKAYCAVDPSDAERWARQAYELSRRSQDVDLELCALSQIGASLIDQGKIEQGIGLLDESMAGSLGGEAGHLETVVFTSCNMMVSCVRCAALKRAMEWVRAAERFVRRYGCPFLYVECRTVYGAVLVARGKWTEAEEELREAVDLARDSVPSYLAEALATLADLRLSQGRLEDAVRLLDRVNDHHAAVPVRARIHLMRGEPDAAAAEVRRRLDVVGEDQLESVLLLERIGDSEIALSRDEAAKDRGRRLAEMGAALGCEVAVARGERLWGRALARTNVDAARKHLDAGLSRFMALDMPYEAAQARLAIAEIVREHEPAVAVVEARAAQNTFEELGAADGANRSAALLRDLGVKGTRAAPKGLDPLTKRENEVLRLLREGLMNPEIAERLYISRKTVEHHVSSILAKLELNNRTEAAAEAERRLGGESVEK